MMIIVNRTPMPEQNRKLHQRRADARGNICLTAFDVFDKVRMLVYHLAKLRALLKEQDDLRKDRLDAEMHDAQGPWTMKTAFHATSGSCVYRSKYTTGKTMITLDLRTLKFLAAEEPATLLPVKIAASQNPGQSSGIVKTITCLQAMWFCSQCISRMKSGMAISLLELNTFAHCVSAFFIYGFWWHKPYDTTSHTFLQSEILDFMFLRRTAASISEPSDRSIRSDTPLGLYTVGRAGATVRIAMMWLKPAQSEREEDATSLRVTEQDMIPGTEFFLRQAGTTRGEIRAVFLPRRSLIHWQQLWRFTAETTLNIADADGCATHKLSGKRLENITDDVSGDDRHVLAVALFPFDASSSTPSRFTSSILANIAFVLYGGLHLLAWRYHFRSTAETILWKMAGVFTASSGVVPLLVTSTGAASRFSSSVVRSLSPRPNKFLSALSCVKDYTMGSLIIFWMIITVAARMYLFIESFVALPNSPPSTYQIPTWSAYIAHI